MWQSISEENYLRTWCKPLVAFFLLLASVGQAADVPLHLRGQPAPGSVIVGQTAPGAEVTLAGKPVQVDEDGWFVFGFGRDATGKRELQVRVDENTLVRELVLQPREWAIQYVEGVPRETVNPPPERLERIRKEAAMVGKARETNSTLTDFRQRFSWPLAAPITGVYGSQRYYNGEPRRPHYGVDLAAPEGTPVYAPAGGVVTLAHPDMFYSGGTLLIDHGLGLSSTFIHLHDIHVSVGERVEQGQLIGEVGSSGRATGPHLDWRINWFKVRLDPQWFLDGAELERVTDDQVVIRDPETNGG